MFTHPNLDQFRSLCAVPGDPPLLEAALLVAGALGCCSCSEKARAEMARHERNLRERLGNTTEPLMQLRILARYLGEEEKFAGNTERYYETDNSFIPCVLDRKTGIPISLSVVAIELGRRLNLPVRGVGLPGHFICSYEAGTKTYFFDPFNGWKTICRQDAERLMRNLFGGDFEVRDEYFLPWSNRQILDRSLRNLKAVYLSRGDLDSALKAVEFILALDPAQGPEIRDRGLIRCQLGKYGLGYEDLLNYLSLCPEAPDAPHVQRELLKVRKQMESVN